MHSLLATPTEAMVWLGSSGLWGVTGVRRGGRDSSNKMKEDDLAWTVVAFRREEQSRAAERARHSPGRFTEESVSPLRHTCYVSETVLSTLFLLAHPNFLITDALLLFHYTDGESEAWES